MPFYLILLKLKLNISCYVYDAYSFFWYKNGKFLK